MLKQHSSQSWRISCAKTAPEADFVTALGLALSRKQIPQMIENTERPQKGMDRWSRSVGAQGTFAEIIAEPPQGSTGSITP